MPLRTIDFESIAYAIPPLRAGGQCRRVQGWFCRRGPAGEVGRVSFALSDHAQHLRTTSPEFGPEAVAQAILAVLRARAHPVRSHWPVHGALESGRATGVAIAGLDGPRGVTTARHLTVRASSPLRIDVPGGVPVTQLHRMTLGM